MVGCRWDKGTPEPHSRSVPNARALRSGNSVHVGASWP